MMLKKMILMGVVPWIAYGSSIKEAIDPVDLQGGHFLHQASLRGEEQAMTLFFKKASQTKESGWAPASSVKRVFYPIHTLSMLQVLERTTIHRNSLIVVPNFFEDMRLGFQELNAIQDRLRVNQCLLVVEPSPYHFKNRELLEALSHFPDLLSRLIISVPIHVGETVPRKPAYVGREIFPGNPYECVNIHAPRYVEQFSEVLQERMVGIVVNQDAQASVDMASFVALVWQQYRVDGPLMLNYIFDISYHPQWLSRIKMINPLEIIK